MTKKVTNTRTREAKPRIVRSDELLERIFERVAKGESLNSICSEPGMPARKSFYEWVAEDETVLRRYEFAMLMRADTYAEDTIDISDDARNDWMETNDPDNPGYRFNGEHVQRSKLRVDARKWYASKLAPKKYGDRVVNEHQGGDPDKPILQNISVSFIAPKSQK